MSHALRAVAVDRRDNNSDKITPFVYLTSQLKTAHFALFGRKLGRAPTCLKNPR
jgi:hypothetical protein